MVSSVRLLFAVGTSTGGPLLRRREQLLLSIKLPTQTIARIRLRCLVIFFVVPLSANESGLLMEWLPERCLQAGLFCHGKRKRESPARRIEQGLPKRDGLSREVSTETESAATTARPDCRDGDRHRDHDDNSHHRSADRGAFSCWGRNLRLECRRRRQSHSAPVESASTQRTAADC